MQATPETRAAILAELKRGDSYAVICARHGVNKQYVSKIAVRNRLRRRNRPGALTDAQEAELAARYVAGEKMNSLAAAFQISSATGLEILLRRNVPTRPCGVVPNPLRHDALDVLTPDAAYWCGIFFTDGTVGHRPKRQAELAVVLQKRDRGHLVKLRDFLGSTNALTPIAPSDVSPEVAAPNGGRGTGAYRFAFSSNRLGDRIETLGRYEPPIDPELTASRDFWRGVVDGDGTVGISCGIPQVKIWGTPWLLSAFVDFLGPSISRRPLRVRPARSIYVVSTSYGTARRVVERLYADADSSAVLDRKAATAAKILVM
jgi:hypothetical protein